MSSLHSFQRPNEAFNLCLAYSPFHTGLRLIPRSVDPIALKAAYRRHAASISTLPSSKGLVATAIDGKTLGGRFDAFADREVAQIMSALGQADQIVLGHLMVDEASNEILAVLESL